MHLYTDPCIKKYLLLFSRQMHDYKFSNKIYEILKDI